MAKAAETFVQIVDLGNGKLLLQAVLTKEQLKEIYTLVEPGSRSWRGQFQSMAKAIVKAYNKWKSGASKG